ncbi:MAG: hypothetical protein V4547_16810 [Bacteroidota bacterium]
MKDYRKTEEEKLEDAINEVAKLKRLLHDLTPGGSEFYNNPEYCAKWIRESRQQEATSLKVMLKVEKEKNQTLTQRNVLLVKALQDVLDEMPPKPTMQILKTIQSVAKEALSNNQK